MFADGDFDEEDVVPALPSKRERRAKRDDDMDD